MQEDFLKHFDRFTQNAKKSLENAGLMAINMGSNYIGTEHLLLGMLKAQGSIGARLLSDMGVRIDNVPVYGNHNIQTSTPSGVIEFSETAKQTITSALRIAQQHGQPYAGTEHLLFAILSQKNSRAISIMKDMGIDPIAVRGELEKYLDSQPFQVEVPVGASNKASSKHTKTPALDHFGIDLTAKALKDLLDPVVGRETQIDRMIQILNRRSKNNPVLIGEPGVGKTAIVEGLAKRIVDEKVPEMLQGKRLMMLDMASVIAGTKFRGEFEERLKKIIDEAIASPNIILFIDELHNVVGAGSAEGAIDAANILKPALSRGEVQTIGATTLDEYRKYIEKDAALERRFQPIIVPEATVEETIEVLRGLRPRYEKFHSVKITDEAIEEAAKLAKRYITDRFMPDKAIDLIDEASAQARILHASSDVKGKGLSKQLEAKLAQIDDAVYNQDFELAARMKSEASIIEQKLNVLTAKNKDSIKIKVTISDITKVVAQSTGIPVEKLAEFEIESLKKLEATIRAKIIGQDNAVDVVAKSIRRSRTGIADPKKPIGSFMFLGPTGVGKTELARVLAEELFNNKDSIIKVDMSEFMEKHTLSRLVGAPAGYVGYEDAGELTEKVRRKPYSLILFDEIEKAHPDIFNILLQILEDGVLTDAKGKKVDFSNTIIIMTSNVGANVLAKEAEIGFATGTPKEQSKLNELHLQMTEKVMSELKKQFRPEFLNRVDHIVVFKALSRIDIAKIAELQLKDLASRLDAKEIVLKFKPNVKALLVEKGYDMNNGARPMRRAVQRLIEDKLATEIVAEMIKPGDSVEIGVKNDEINLAIKVGASIK
ncbi:ATP-dependent Clp protease ATP-binding subunit [Candidatus Saccharibacteria bacterium]|nr:ATP-dependent Clp protease ATP-binding subunit [Candidatus Saccharibacteria bacterium]